MSRFVVREREKPVDAKPRWVVIDTKSDLPVANFPTREEAEAHVKRLEQGPFDLDEQEQWKEEDDEWGDWESWE